MWSARRQALTQSAGRRTGGMARARNLSAAAAPLLALLLLPAAPASRAGTADEAPALPARAADVRGFVPPGWEIEQQHDADLDRDGRRDALLLLRPAAASAPSGAGSAGRSPARLLVVVVGRRDSYALSASNARLIPRVDLASQEDPLADGELTVRLGRFDIRLGLTAGMGSYLSASLLYRFRRQDGCFRLIGYDRLETHRATLATRDLSINFLTGGVVRTSGNAQSGATEVQRSRLAANPRRCFQDLGSAADFQPL